VRDKRYRYSFGQRKEKIGKEKQQVNPREDSIEWSAGEEKKKRRENCPPAQLISRRENNLCISCSSPFIRQDIFISFYSTDTPDLR